MSAGLQLKASVDLSGLERKAQKIKQAKKVFKFTDAELQELGVLVGEMAGASYFGRVMTESVSKFTQGKRFEFVKANEPVDVLRSGKSLPARRTPELGAFTGFLWSAIEGRLAPVGGSGPTVKRRIANAGRITSGIEYGLNAAPFAESAYFKSPETGDFGAPDSGGTTGPYVKNLQRIGFVASIGDAASSPHDMVNVSTKDSEVVLATMKNIIAKHIKEEKLGLFVL